MAPDAFFDFMYNATDARPHQVLREDYYYYYYPPTMLMDLAADYGFKAEQCDDWSGNRQAKLQLRQG